MSDTSIEQARNRGTWGELRDFVTAEYIRQATQGEWRMHADYANLQRQDRPQTEDGHAFQVFGGPDWSNTGMPAFRSLREDAAARGDLQLVAKCELAMSCKGNGDSAESSAALRECTALILDAIMAAAAA